jgi:uncharacterized membrane protein
MAQSIPVIEGSLTTPKVRIITTEHPWHWLEAGCRDMLKTPLASFFYGAVFVVMGYILTNVVVEKFQYALAFTAGFFLAGPFLATGLYDLSRRLEKGERASLGTSMLAWRHNTLAFLLFGIMVGIILIIWARLSAVLFGALFLSDNPTVDPNAAQLFFSGDGLKFLLVFVLVGAVLAGVVFVISVVSIPMLLDCKTDLITAVVTSVTAVQANPGPMALWAALIVMFTGVGLIPLPFLNLSLGLIITMPLIGHATWYAYRDLVEPEKTSTG